MKVNDIIFFKEYLKVFSKLTAIVCLDMSERDGGHSFLNVSIKSEAESDE